MLDALQLGYKGERDYRWLSWRKYPATGRVRTRVYDNGLAAGATLYTLADWEKTQERNLRWPC